MRSEIGRIEGRTKYRGEEENTYGSRVCEGNIRLLDLLAVSDSVDYELLLKCLKCIYAIVCKAL